MGLRIFRSPSRPANVTIGVDICRALLADLARHPGWSIADSLLVTNGPGQIGAEPPLGEVCPPLAFWSFLITVKTQMDSMDWVFDGVGSFFGGMMRGFERGITSLFGSSNARYVRRLQGKVEAINALEETYQKLNDAELREQTVEFRKRLRAGETVDDILIEAFAVCREAGRRYLGMRHYDTQLIGGMVLHSGAIAEMVTGEGKTLVATLPAYLNALEGKGVHVVTVNDYLARRDMEWMGPLYMGMGLTVGAIQSNMTTAERQKAYDSDITYGTNNEFGFDYLRDNMRPAARGDNRWPKDLQQSQRPLHYAIVDEVDNILIDEARTPLIISGSAFDNPKKYADADKVARALVKEEHFVVNEKDHNVHLTDAGVRAAERLAGVESFYTAGNMEWPHLIDNSLKAHFLYKLDVNYVVKEGRVVIVDEFTGRLMEGRQWSDGLHQAVEAKEGVKIKEETQTLATVTLQNFFKLYKKIGGMTGTAMTEANEFWKIYKLDVVAIPTHRVMQRIEHPDVIYRSEREKFEALAEEIERYNKWDVIEQKDGNEIWGNIHSEKEDAIVIDVREKKDRQTIPREQVARINKKGRPILVGTVSIEKSERLSRLLEQRGIHHDVLNAKQHQREAMIVAQAGRLRSVTIATNMAGRGTDIILGGNAETLAWAQLQDKYPTRLEVPPAEWDALVHEIESREGMKAEGKIVKELGGLHVIGTERHEARRIDLQLRGRCGRQGDPGSSRFFLSLDDDLMRIFAGPWVKSMLERLGMQEGERIESRMVSRRIEAAQKKVEERHFDARKNLLEYDEVMDEQRKRVYSFRQRILDGENCSDIIESMIEKQVDLQAKVFLDTDFGVDSFAVFAGSRLSVELRGKDFRGMDFDQAVDYAKDEAQRMAESHVQDAIDENLPGDEDADQDDWNWEALAKMGHTRWGLNWKDSQLKRMGKSSIGEFMTAEARAAITKVDLSEGKVFLEPDFRQRTLLGWLKAKFDIELPMAEIAELDLAGIRQHVKTKTAEKYREKEAEYPVMAGYYRFSSGQGSNRQVDKDALINWASSRFGMNLSTSDFINQPREQVFQTLFAASRENQKRADSAIEAVIDHVDELYEKSNDSVIARHLEDGDASVKSLAQWMSEKYQCELDPEELGELNRSELQRKLIAAVEDHHRPEMRRMERRVLLEVVDDSWKGHLLSMDRLRSAVGLVGYAQLDAKVEYKREGMKAFDQMWDQIGEQVTDLVFRMESVDEGFVKSTFVESAARHDSAPSLSEEQRQTQATIDAVGKDDVRPEPIRNRGARPGRNDPCPCGSGKKYKNCCMRGSNTLG